MRVLVTWGSKSGGTEGIARIVGDVLQEEGHDVTLRPAAQVHSAATIDSVDAVIVGGAIYANQWHRDARRLVARHVAELRKRPVWFFSSGPLDNSAGHRDIPPIRQVSVLMQRVGARGHVTFGGRLAAEAQGFPARAMAKTHSGDWRNPERVRAWASELARDLPGAAPGLAAELPGRSRTRLLAHGLAGGATCAAAMASLLLITSPGIAITLHTILAPAVFLAAAVLYFRVRGAREPLPTALTFGSLMLLLGAIPHRLALLDSFTATWLPLLLVIGVTWATGALLSTLPWTRPPRTTPQAA